MQRPVLVELVEEVIKRITVIEGQARIHNVEDQLCFEHAVHLCLYTYGSRWRVCQSASA